MRATLEELPELRNIMHHGPWTGNTVEIVVLPWRILNRVFQLDSLIKMDTSEECLLVILCGFLLLTYDYLGSPQNLLTITKTHSIEYLNFFIQRDITE